MYVQCEWCVEWLGMCSYFARCFIIILLYTLYIILFILYTIQYIVYTLCYAVLCTVYIKDYMQYYIYTTCRMDIQKASTHFRLYFLRIERKTLFNKATFLCNAVLLSVVPTFQCHLQNCLGELVATDAPLLTVQTRFSQGITFLMQHVSTAVSQQDKKGIISELYACSFRG